MGGAVFLPLGVCLYQSHAKIRKEQVTIREEKEAEEQMGQAQHSKVLESWRTTRNECKEQETDWPGGVHVGVKVLSTQLRTLLNKKNVAQK